jgi:hypothetical protein
MPLEGQLEHRLAFFNGFGGITSLDGLAHPDTRQTNSRIGTTAAVPVSKHQSLKVSYNTGTYIRFGGDYQNDSVAWQYSWLGRPNQRPNCLENVETI